MAKLLLCDCTEYVFMIDGKRIVFPSSFSPVCKAGYHSFSLTKAHAKAAGLERVDLVNRRGTWYMICTCEQIARFKTKKWAT